MALKNIFNTKSVSMSSPDRQSMGILDDYAVRKVINTQEGTLEKTPVNSNDIVNKSYVDSGNSLSGIYLFISGSNATQALNIGANNFTSANTIRGGFLRGDNLISSRIALVGASGILADNANISYLGNNIFINGTANLSGADISGDFTLSGGDITYTHSSGHFIINDDDGAMINISTDEGRLSGAMKMDIHAGVDDATDYGLKIHQGYTGTSYQNLLQCNDNTGQEVFGIWIRGSDQAPKLFLGGNLLTSSQIDANGLRILTSVLAAQFTVTKGLFLGTSYAQGTAISGAYIKTQSTLPLVFQPKGVTTHYVDSTKEYLLDGIKFGLGMVTPLDIFHISGGAMVLQNTTQPSYNVSGGSLYASGGALFFRGMNGTVTKVADA